MGVMIIDTVEYYLKEILSPTLKDFGVSNDFIAAIVGNVGEQLISILKHWNDAGFRKTILLIGSEEGYFYSPVTNKEIRCMVVVAIRNSLFETLCSVDFERAGLDEPLPDNDIRTITGDAIIYFDKLDLAAISDRISQTDTNTIDIYGGIKSKYPVSWRALTHLVTGKKSARYPKKQVSEVFQIREVDNFKNAEKTNKGRTIKVVLDGCSAVFDETMLENLMGVDRNEMGAFLFDSFKMCTRNIDKLFRVMEFLLTRGAVFATSNYFISNGHAEQRSPILRATHSVEEAMRNWQNYNGVRKRHLEVLKSLNPD